ncbi:MAG: hypothetical protein O7D91_05245 [Planctomycetota bacterium]|nr:hypothetical protein [Planctomycetota bacterium]
MRFSGVRTSVPFALAALGTLCLAVFSVQAFDQPPQKTSPETQSKPVELMLELEASPASPAASSSKLVQPADATRRAMGGRAPANGGCGDGVCDGDENCGNCTADCGECACANVYPGDCDDANLGIQGPFVQECGDGGWIGLAFPIETGGGMIDTVAFHLETNRAGGDVYIMGDAGCRPDTSNILASLCCALSGLTPNAAHELHFDAVMTSADEPTWVVLVGRTGRTRTNSLGFFDGGVFKAFGLSRSAIEPSLPNRAFANLVGTGNPGDWTDLHEFSLGSPFCVGLSFTGQDPGGPYDCVANPDPTGACCNVDGAECQMMRGFECGIAGGIYVGDGTTCDDCFTACNTDAGACCEANGTPGCDDPMCCHYVCGLDPVCCTADKQGWDSICAAAANDPQIGCGQIGEVCDFGVCVPVAINASAARIQTGPDLEQDGALRVIPAEYGAWARIDFCAGPCNSGDFFKPVGFDAAQVMLGNALFLYIDRGDPDLNQRVVLSAQPGHATAYPIDIGPSALFPEIPPAGAAVSSDTNDDGLDDSSTSSFAVCNALTDVSLTFDLTQSVELVASGPGVGVSVLTQTHTITNESLTAIDFVLIRQVDADLMWIGDGYDDAVGTMTHADGGDLSVYTMEHNRTTTAVTLSSPQAAFYYGGKGDFDPDGSGTCEAELCVGGPHAGEPCNPLNCPGVDCICEGGPIMGCGIDFQQWDAYGLPEGWGNFVANVGYDTDGDSGGSPAGCDGSSGGCSCEAGIGIVIPVSLDPGESTCVCIQHTYGQRTPWMGGTCPAGCGGECGPCPTDVDDDGDIDAFDLAVLLGSWGPVTQDSVCLDADQNGVVGAFDLAVLLANWGACE